MEQKKLFEVKIFADLIVKTEEYIAEFEPQRVIEDLFNEFGSIEKKEREFLVYCKGNNIKYDRKVKRRESEMQRRELYIKWYIDNHQQKTTVQCIAELERILFISQATIRNIIGLN